MHNKAQEYLQGSGLLYIYQSGFRANHFTDTCFYLLVTMIINGAESGKDTDMILIDLQNTYDNLDHNILLDKMKCISFSDKAIKWFHS